jgi:hypothetical protein
MSLFHNKTLVFASLLSLGILISVPCARGQDNPNERTAGVFVGKYDIVKDSHSVPFLDQLATNGIPAVYGEILGQAASSGAQAFKDEAWKGGDIAKQLATQQYVRDSLKRVADAIGDLTAVLDVGGKLYAEQYDEAAISTALTLLGKYAGSESGGALLKTIGITSTAYVTAAVVAFQVWRESAKALAAETNSRQLESLYGSIELMTRDRSRSTLGQGDPFPPSAENIEKVWKRVLNDPSFRALFRVYVTDQLNREFPEPGYFDSIATYASAPFASKSIAETDEEKAQAELQKDYTTLKSYITGLVSWLNKAEKVRENQTIARQELQKLADRIKQSSGDSMEQAIAKMDNAITMLGVVEVYLKDCNDRIDAAIKDKEIESLQVHMKMIADYVRDVIAWIPDRGPVAERRNIAFSGLKTAYSKAEAGFNLLLGEIKTRLEKPKVPDPPAEAPKDLPKVDPLDMYKSYFREILKPFDWGGIRDVSVIKERYLKMLQTGQFAHPLDNKTGGLPGGRKPLAEEIEKAWSIEDYSLASGSGSKNPEEKDTIQGYKNYLLKKISEVKTPDEIVSLNASVSAQGAEISRIYREGNNLFWLKTEEGENVSGETEEQRKARRLRGEEKMALSQQMGEALKPSKDRLQALTIAWDQAKKMAGETAAGIILTAKLTRDETTTWMSQTKTFFINGLNPLFQEYQTLNTRVAAFEAPYNSLNAAGLDSTIEGIRSIVSNNSYVGLQGTKIPESTALFSGAIDGANRLMSTIYNGVEPLNGAGKTIQKQIDLIDTMQYLATQWDDFAKDAYSAASEINIFIDPSFMKDGRFTMLQDFFGEMEKKANNYREKLVSLNNQCSEYLENRQADAAWLERAVKNLLRLRDEALQAGVLGNAETLSHHLNRSTNMVNGEKTVITSPYQRYWTETERNSTVSSLRNIIETTNLAPFLTGVAPWLDREIKRYLDELSSLPVIQEENFFIGSIPTGEKVHVVLKSKLNEATAIVNSLVPGDKGFDEAFNKLRTIIPVGNHFKSATDQFADLKAPANAPLSKDFIALREKFIELYYKHQTVSAEKQKDEFAKLARDALARWASLAGPLKERIKNGDELVKKAADIARLDRSSLESLVKNIESLMGNLNSDPLNAFTDASYSIFMANLDRGEYGSDIHYINDGMRRLPEQLDRALSAVKSRLMNFDDSTEAVKQFYETFKRAYEDKNDSGLMNCLSDQWEAGDGTTLYDVEQYFRNMFTVFDEIKLDITNMKVEKSGGSTYRVSYELLITGRIFSENMAHKEKSSVFEEVTVNGGKIKISRTPEGRFWYVN